jgi:hypothetical protein
MAYQLARIFFGKPIDQVPNVCFYTCLFTLFNTRVKSYVDSLVGCSLLRVEILDES